MDLLDACAYHQLALGADGRSVATQKLYMTYQRAFLDYLNARRIPPTLDALNPLNVRNATDWFRADRATGARDGQCAVQMFVATLKTWAAFLEREGVFEESPIARVKRPKVAKRLREPFTPQEIMALWAASQQTHFPVRDEALLLLLFDTGIRIGEAVTLTLDKLRLDERHLVVGLEGKGRRERLVPIGDPTKRDGGRTLRALRTWLKHRPESQSDYVFVDRRGFSIGAAAGSDIFKRIGTLAGVANAIPHRARHSFCTHYLTANPGDELGLRRIVGHVSREVLADYVHFASTTIAQRAGLSSLVETLSAPKPAPRVVAAEPIATAWSRRPLPAPAPDPYEALEGQIAALQAELARLRRSSA